MRIAVLSDPNNFHTQKWAKALERAGAEVVVMSFDAYSGNELTVEQIHPRFSSVGRYSYVSYLTGGKRLRQALSHHRIDLVNALNVTPFGVWAMKSGFHPLIICAFGADILEYPPDPSLSPDLRNRSWDSSSVGTGWLPARLNSLKRNYYRKKVAGALNFADLITADNQHLIDCMGSWFGLPAEKRSLLRWGIEQSLFDISDEQREEVRKLFAIGSDSKVVLSPRGAKLIYQADIILEAFGKLLEAGCENVNFIMLGAGYEVADVVMREARRLESAYPNFRFYPEAFPRETIHALWNLVDIFISAPIYDGYSAALAEGRYVGAVPVVNGIPANRELILHGENGWICDPFTAEQLSLDLQYLLANLGRYSQRFCGVNREWIERNSVLDENAGLFMEMARKLTKKDGGK